MANRKLKMHVTLKIKCHECYNIDFINIYMYLKKAKIDFSKYLVYYFKQQSFNTNLRNLLNISVLLINVTFDRHIIIIIRGMADPENLPRGPASDQVGPDKVFQVNKHTLENRGGSGLPIPLDPRMRINLISVVFVCPFTFLNCIISRASCQIFIKFYVDHH